MAAPLGNQNYNTGKRWRDAINRALESRSRSEGIQALELLAEKLLVKCDEGDLQALKELGDRVDGKAMQSMELGGPNGGPLQFAEVKRTVVDPRDTDS